jgi:hypothetical protein
MPYENVADVDGESLRCWVCDGILRPETTIVCTLRRGVAVPQLWTSMAWQRVVTSRDCGLRPVPSNDEGVRNDLKP